MIEDQKRVVLIKTNSKSFDTRLSKEIKALLEFGYHVTLLFWNRNLENHENHENNSKYVEIGFNLKAPTGIKILIYMPLWWIFQTYWLIKLNLNYIHSINLDTILPSLIISKIRGKKIIYEMYDTYEDHVILPKIIRNFIMSIDKIIMFYSDIIILVDESRIAEFKKIPNKNLVIIYNSPENKKIYPIKTNSKFNIFFAGALEKNRSIEKIMDIVKSLDDVNLKIAGFGKLSELIKSYANDYNDKINFIGSINYDEVIKNSMSADLLFSLYDPKIPLNKFASSNKLFEAMMCSKPILVSKNTSMADKVNLNQCGLVVDCEDCEEIQKSILFLKENPEICKKLGNNGRIAYETKYDWKIMKKRLFDIYNKF